MNTATLWHAGVASDAGLERSTNEDRVYVDEANGIFLVVDGVGGQAAGEKAAEIAVQITAGELARDGDHPKEPPEERVRRSIVAANNEIFELAASHPEWQGMACVLTLAIAHNDRIVVGHVGDSRLYLAWDGNLRKVTSDHSPVGEREDMGELTEQQAMRHPSRNQVFREVGSMPHQAHDEDFIEVRNFPFRGNAAILLCSDGLSDALMSSEISAIVETYSGDPASVARELVSAANRAGGRDNISVIFVAGPEFMGTEAAARKESRARHAITRVRRGQWRKFAGRMLWLVAGVALGILAGRLLSRFIPAAAATAHLPVTINPTDPHAIARALSAARPGDTIQVPAGEFLGPIVLVDGVNLISSGPGAAVIRADPAAVADTGIAFVARGIRTGRLSGFRVIGDDRSPLATGVLIEDAGVEIEDLDISGAGDCGMRIAGASAAVLRANWIHANHGCGVSIGAGSSPRLWGNRISENGIAPDVPRQGIEIHGPASPAVENNIVTGNGQPNPELGEHNVTEH
jgi:serine/threonine protein phosphatase PrpC